jgi:hypothetical protein
MSHGAGEIPLMALEQSANACMSWSAGDGDVLVMNSWRKWMVSLKLSLLVCLIWQ